MIKVRFPFNKYEEYCKYKMKAYEDFSDNAVKLAKKKRIYLNGNKDYWFSNKDYKNTVYGILQSMAFESIVFEVKKLK